MPRPTMPDREAARDFTLKVVQHARRRESWATVLRFPQRRVKWSAFGATSTERGSDAQRSRSAATADDDNPRTARAGRRGYIVHGAFKLKIAYLDDVYLDTVVRGIERGSYERPEGENLHKLVDPGDRVIELGAGLGLLSALTISSVAVADYVAVEADPRLADVIRRTHQLNGIDGPLTIASCVATCDETMISEGAVDFNVSKKFCASSLGKVGRFKHTVQVPVVSLPDLVREHRSNVLICDIEGGETDIFNGTDLGSIEKVLMEIHPNRLGQSGVRSVMQNIDKLGLVYDCELSAGNVLGFRKLAD